MRKRQELRPNCYPFAILYDFPQRQDFWGMSTCELILDNQKLINKVESIMAMIGTLTQNPQKYLHSKANINIDDVKKFGNAPGQIFVGDLPADQAMNWLRPPEIPSQLFNLADQARANVREITGMNEAYMGQNVGSLQTSSGVNSLIERSTLRDRDQMYDFELFIEDLSVTIIKFITEYYDEPRIARILKREDQEPEFIEFIGSDFRDMAYDVKVDVSARAPISRLRRQEEMDKLLTLQGQMKYEPSLLTPQEYMSNADFIDGKDIINRMNMEEIQGAEAIMTEVLQMMVEAQQGGLPPEEINAMAGAMLQERFAQKQNGGGMGDTSPNAGEFQMRQGAPGM